MYTISKFHIEKEAFRHWCPVSEPFTGGDALQSAIEQGWQVSPAVELYEHVLSGSRKVCVYTFELQRAAECMRMPVIGNPHVDRMIRNLECTITVSALVPTPMR